MLEIIYKIFHKKMSKLEGKDKISLYNNDFMKFFYYQDDSPNNDTKKKQVTNKGKMKTKKLKINPLSKYEFLFNDSQTGKQIKHKNTKKKNFINLTSNDKNSTNNISTKNDKNNKHSRQYPNNRFKKTSHSSLDIFLESVKQHEEHKKQKINNLKTEMIKQQLSEIRKFPKILKRSVKLANSKGRDPLYLKRPLSEEKSIERDFFKFYKKHLNIINKEKVIPTNAKKTQEKFKKIYEDNIQWKKNKEEMNNTVRCKNNKQVEDDMNKTLTFRPLLNQNSLRIIQKLNNNKKVNINQYNDLYHFENERELLDKLKLKLKPVLSEYFNINNTKRPYLTKKSLYIANNLTENNRRTPMGRTRSYKINPNKNKRDIKSNVKNTKIDEAINEESKNETLNENRLDKNLYKHNKKEYYLLQKIKEIKKSKTKGKKELYKINIRQATAWNQQFVNNIIPKGKYGLVIEGLL